MRFDDGPDIDYTMTYQELMSRGLVGGFATIRNKINMADHATLAQIKTMQDNGMEIMCHSRTHVADPATFEIFKDEAVVAGHEMRALKLDIASFVQPGTWVIPGTYKLNNAYFGTAPDLVLRKNYWAYEAYGNLFDGGYYLYNMPRSVSTRFAADTLSIDPWTVSAFEAFIDTIVPGKGAELLFHSANIGLPRHTTVEDFNTMLDYVAAKVAAGVLDVLTPTQQIYATPI
jgi:hypothetical protein